MNKRCALQPNYVLKLEKRNYRLQGEPIQGGSSLVYKARLENDITADFFMIKEFFPADLADDIERLPDNSLHFPASIKKQINLRKERTARESKIVSELRHEESNNNPWFLSYSKIIKANKTLYTVIATEAGEVLSERIGHFKTFEEICDCALSILDALEPLHKKGYLHLDVSPDNIHFSDTKIARLIDFNSACRSDEPFERLILSVKDGYSAMELYRQAQPTPATDLFSVAAIFFVMLLGRPQGDDDRTPGICFVNSEDGFLKGASELLVTKTNEFLIKGISHTPLKRFQSVQEMREAVEDLRQLKIEIDLVNSPNRVKPNKYFIPREHDIKKIDAALTQNNYVFLEGIGGIGKTELAKSYAQEKNYDIVQFINFGRNLQETIAYDLAFFNFDALKYEPVFGKDAAKHIFHDKVNHLKQCVAAGQKILIIIDNYSHTSLQDFKTFTAGEYHVIFTTREKLGGVEISPMKDDSLFKMFCKYYSPLLPNADDTPLIHEIIKAVAGHTMSVMLIAAAMRNDNITAKEMLQRLQDGIETNTNINIDKEWINNPQQAMMRHIFMLFDMTRIKQENNFAHIMVNMSVVPETGLEKNEFFQLTQCNNFDLNWLIERRWVQDENSNVSLHAVIADVASRELLPTSVNCGGLLNGLISFANKSTYMEAANAANKLKTACSRINDATPLTAELYSKFARLCSFLADYDSALKYYEKTAAIRKTAWDYNNIAKIQMDRGNYTKALKLYEKTIEALAITYNDELAAIVFGDLGGIHIQFKDYDLAIECYQRALNSYVSIHGYEHPDSARMLNNIACAYLHKKDYDQAKAWFGKALALRKKILGENHPDTATTYGNIALGCTELGQYEKALRLEEKALTVRENVFGTEHPKTALSYNNIGLIYACKKDFNKALEFYQKALEIYEKILGDDHPDTIATQRNIHEFFSALQLTTSVNQLKILCKNIPPRTK